MLYRIVNSPPGYRPDERYMVCAYETLDLATKICNVRKVGGTVFAASLKDARTLIPFGAERLQYVADELTIELWEISVSK